MLVTPSLDDLEIFMDIAADMKVVESSAFLHTEITGSEASYRNLNFSIVDF